MPNFDDMMDEGKDRFNAWNEGRKKRSNELSTTLVVTSGKTGITDKFLPNISIYQQNDGYIYFNKDDSRLFELLEYHWNGPKYKTVTHSTTTGKNKGKEKTKVKRKGRVTGAVVGSLIAPGVGTAIGALHGTGNKEIKGKNKGKNESHTETTEEQVEVATPAFIRVRNIVTNEESIVNFQCRTEIDIILSQFTIFNDNNRYDNTMYNDTQTSDPYEEIKKAKELLDMGIITQDEFDQKKKELLGL